MNSYQSQRKGQSGHQNQRDDWRCWTRKSRPSPVRLPLLGVTSHEAPKVPIKWQLVSCIFRRRRGTEQQQQQQLALLLKQCAQSQRSSPSPERFPCLPCWVPLWISLLIRPSSAFFQLPSLILSSGASSRMKPTKSANCRAVFERIPWLTSRTPLQYTCTLRHNQVLKFKPLQRPEKLSAHWRVHARNRHGTSPLTSSAALLESFFL